MTGCKASKARCQASGQDVASPFEVLFCCRCLFCFWMAAILQCVNICIVFVFTYIYIYTDVCISAGYSKWYTDSEFLRCSWNVTSFVCYSFCIEWIEGIGTGDPPKMSFVSGQSCTRKKSAKAKVGVFVLPGRMWCQDQINYLVPQRTRPIFIVAAFKV